MPQTRPNRAVEGPASFGVACYAGQIRNAMTGLYGDCNASLALSISSEFFNVTLLLCLCDKSVQVFASNRNSLRLSNKITQQTGATLFHRGFGVEIIYQPRSAVSGVGQRSRSHQRSPPVSGGRAGIPALFWDVRWGFLNYLFRSFSMRPHSTDGMAGHF